MAVVSSVEHASFLVLHGAQLWPRAKMAAEGVGKHNEQPSQVAFATPPWSALAGTVPYNARW